MREEQSFLDFSDEEVKAELMKQYFCALVPEDVVTTNKLGSIFIAGEPLQEGEASALETEAKMFKEMRLYKLLFGTLIDQAYKTMFEKSTNFDDMRNGKMMLYNIGVQKNIVDKLSRLSASKASPRLQEDTEGIKLE